MPETRNPLGEATNRRRVDKSKASVGSKRHLSASVGSDSQRPRRETSYSERSDSSMPATNRRASQYLSQRDASVGSESSFGRSKPSINFTSSSRTSTARPPMRLQPGRTPVGLPVRKKPEPKVDEESRRATMELKSKQDNLQAQVDMLVRMNESKDTQKSTELEAKLSIIQAQLRNAEKELAEKNAQFFERNLELQTLKREREMEKELFREQVQKVKRAEDDLRDMQKKVQQDVVDNLKNLNNEKAEKDNFEKKHRSTLYDLEAKQAECKRLHDDVTVLERKRVALSETIAQAEVKISQLEESLKNSQKAKEEKDATVEELRRELTQLEKVNSDIILSEKQLNNEASALREQLAEMESTNETHMKEIARLQHAGSDTKKSLESQMQDQNEKLAELSKALEESKGLHAKNLTSQGEEVNRLLQENKTLGLKIDSFVRKDTEKQAELEELRRTVADYVEKFKIKEGEVRDLLRIRRKQHNTIMELKGNIRVFCRVRPFLGDEAGKGEKLNFTITENKTIKALPQDNKRADANTQFSFDHVFGPDAQQQDVFEEISELVQSALDGYRVCIFAYGQTGSGKTHTMIGGDTEDTMGMIPRSVEQIFEVAAEMKERGWSFEFTASFIEIYNETCRDLLVNSRATDKDKKVEAKICPKTNKVLVPGLTTEVVSNKAGILKLLARSNKNRATAETAMNERSSRSHSVFRLGIEAHNAESGATLNGGLNLVDLAGSERLNKSRAEGERLTETRSINKSLSALSNVIASLANNSKHIPYRNSKLTTLLSDSLGGDSKTLMFCNVGPSQTSYSESVSSLRFASTVNECHIGTAKRNTKIDPK